MINANTRIAAILKQEPSALEAIISLSPKFNKLRNPLLRKLMASRTSLSMASRIGGCRVEDFFTLLEPHGFVADRSVTAEKEEGPGDLPAFMQSPGKAVVELDVRPIIESGRDPFRDITGRLKELGAGEVLKLVNSFEPLPLIQVLGRQGYEYYVERIDENLVNTYFHKTATSGTVEKQSQPSGEDWERIMQRFGENVEQIDVRALEMPLPMMTILEALEKLPAEKALFVHHKRIPVFLLPELAERKFDYRIKEIGENEVHLLIFKL